MKEPIGFTIIDGLIDNCDEIIQWLETRHWEQSAISSDKTLDSIRTSETQFVEMLNWTNPDFIHKMNKAVWESIDSYAKKWEFSFYDIENVSIQKYDKGKEYKVHTDHFTGRQRICSAVLYLNDGFDGGETFFPHMDFSVIPKAGRLAIFPSNFIYAHAALPVKKGIKYAAAYWANG